jgi:hypothetical protein
MQLAQDCHGLSGQERDMRATGLIALLAGLDQGDGGVGSPASILALSLNR